MILTTATFWIVEIEPTANLLWHISWQNYFNELMNKISIFLLTNHAFDDDHMELVFLCF